MLFRSVALIVLAFPLMVAVGVHGMPLPAPLYGVSTESDIVYGTGDTWLGPMELELDLYRPVDIGKGPVPALAPGIVLVHGGSFISGEKEDLAPFAEFFAGHGYAVASIQYRLAGDLVPATPGPADDFPFPLNLVADTINAGVEDATTAMVWMRDHAAEYNIDADKLVLGGGSAGAIISLLQAYNRPPARAAPKAVLSYLGAMFGTEQTIAAGAAPAFVVASSDDDVVPFPAPLGTVAAVDRMNQVGVYNEFYVQTGIGHDVDFTFDFGGKTLAQRNLEFLDRFVPVPPLPALIVGDANNDGLVTGADIIAVQQNFRAVEPGIPTGRQLGDANDDGQVTGADLISVQRNFATDSVPANPTVPEPAALFAIGVCGLGLIRPEHHFR